MHKPITFENISFSFKHKTCIDGFNAQVHFGDRIAIIGDNGSGKTTLLKSLMGVVDAYAGRVIVPLDVRMSYVPQVIDTDLAQSGGQRFNHALTQALAISPNVLLLDEPTNHLDKKNRRSLLRMLQNFYGTLIIVSHDDQLLRSGVDNIWHIEQQSVTIFHGLYGDYQQKRRQEKKALEQQILALNKEKQFAHAKLMREQKRSASSKAMGQKNITNRKWPTVVSKAKVSRSTTTSGSKRAAIVQKKQQALTELSALNTPDVVVPRFCEFLVKKSFGMLVDIQGASVAYRDNQPVLKNIYLSVKPDSRIAIEGDNGSGKTTLVRAVMGDDKITRQGQWHMMQPEAIGYLDQHYANIPKGVTVLEALTACVPHWHITDIRRHLADFLFKDNRSVNQSTDILSGGERARLSLAMIAANPCSLLILDEITNNIDQQTLSHVTQVISCYPGALMVISHSDAFLKAINIDTYVYMDDFV
jgi:ATPase subunit of ABC transporter with duplicated ATPase domains